MSLFRCASAFVLLAVGMAVAAYAQTDKSFPSEYEINLMLTQAEQAIQQYKPLIDQQESQVGKSAQDAATNDRQVAASLQAAVNALKSNPQEFNGPLGFAFFQWLDDASRNAALCASSASSQAESQMKNGNTAKANTLHHLAQSCTDASSLLHAVSKDAGSLYVRYLEAERQSAIRNDEMMKQCTEILKRYDTSPIKPLR
ncbi:MAG: hypothetical protein ABSB30_11520 [Terracidiphilus sp.]|jgi:hypothetical protein